jgi:coproporphyrinogen III oxidase-like Fe-S oxidoreductase
MAEVGAGRLPVGGEEVLTKEERRLERLLLGLRTARGVPESWIEASGVATFVAEGLADRRNGRVVLTDRGQILANEIVLALAE